MNTTDTARGFYLLLSTCTLASLVFGLAALWAARGRSGWPWRIAPLVLLLASLVPLGAYELIAMFGAQVALVLLLARVQCMFTRVTPVPADPTLTSNAAWRFSLHDVLKAVLLAGLVLAIARFAAAGTASATGAPIVWWIWGVVGVALGFATSVAAWLTFGRARWYLRWLATAFVLVPIAIGCELVLPPYMNFFGSGAGLEAPTCLCSLAVLALVCGPAVALWIIHAGWPQRQSNGEWTTSSSNSAATHRKPAHWPARIVAFAALAACGWFFAVLYIALVPAAAPPPEKLPVPNGYDHLTAAAAAIYWAAIPSQDYEAAPITACQAFALANSSQLAEVRAAFLLPSQVPVEYNGAVFSNSINGRVSIFRSLARALCAEAKAHSGMGRVELAAESRLDIYRVSRAISRRGLVIDELVANAIGGVGDFEIIADWQSLDGVTLGRVARELLAYDASREPIEAIIDRDALWGKVATGWLGRLWAWIEATVAGGNVSARVCAMVRDRTSAHMRLIATEAAIRQHILAVGSPPNSLAALVPSYLPVVPLDPYSGKPLVYRRTEDGYLLYSVGNNGVDDGGQRVGYVSATVTRQGDLFFDADPNRD